MAVRKGTHTTHNAQREGDHPDDEDEVVNPFDKDAPAVKSEGQMVVTSHGEAVPEATPYAEDPLVPMWWVRAFGVGVPFEPVNAGDEPLMVVPTDIPADPPVGTTHYKD